MTRPSAIEDGTAAAVFGDTLPRAERYAHLLCGGGRAWLERWRPSRIQWLYMTEESAK